MNAFTIVDSAIINPDTGDTKPIAGIPEYHKQTFGKYAGKSPIVAASKALTSIYKHMNKYPDWFPDYEHGNPPHVIIVIKNISTEKLYAYVANVIAKEEPVTLASRTYKFTNKLKPIPLNSVGWGASGDDASF